MFLLVSAYFCPLKRKEIYLVLHTSGVCLLGGLCPGGSLSNRGCCPGGPGVPGRRPFPTATVAVGTHLTGMFSCLIQLI